MPEDLPDREGPECHLPEYDDATKRLLMECFHGLAAAQDPVIRMISSAPADEIPNGGVPVGVTHGSYAQVEVNMRFALATEAVLRTDVDEWAASVQESVDEARPTIVGQFFAAMGELLRDTGQEIDLQGEALSHDVLCQMLEKMQLDFDAEGNPKMPTAFMSPEAVEKLMANPPTAENDRRLADIIERKRREFNACRRVRKLDRKDS